MIYPEKEEGKPLIGVWVHMLDKSTAPDLAIALNKCDMVYAVDGKESLESLKRRVSGGKIKIFPEYVNNDDSAMAWLNERHGEDGYTYMSMKTMCLFAGMDEKVRTNMENFGREVKKRLPEGVVAAVENLNDEMHKMNERRATLFGEYHTACVEQGISWEQGRAELDLYFQQKVPAAELLAPVDICRELRDGLDGLGSLDVFAD